MRFSSVEVQAWSYADQQPWLKVSFMAGSGIRSSSQHQPTPATPALPQIALFFSLIHATTIPEYVDLNLFDVPCGSTVSSRFHRCSGVFR